MNNQTGEGEHITKVLEELEDKFFREPYVSVGREQFDNIKQLIITAILDERKRIEKEIKKELIPILERAEKVLKNTGHSIRQEIEEIDTAQEVVKGEDDKL
jgi:hypothetical protein